jgi:hypothetical protein
LKEAILGGNESLSEKEIMLVLRVDMRYTPTVSRYADRLPESLDLESSVAHRKCCLGARVPISGRGWRLRGAWCCPKQRDQQKR